MSKQANVVYQQMIFRLLSMGIPVHTRNADTLSCINYPRITFNETPLVTLRKTAWKMALREMQWFMSGDTKCPDELLPWWKDQLGHGAMYRGGYSHQFRRSGYNGTFDQIKYLLNGLQNNPNSRRLVMTTWNPSDMAHITELNHNDCTPSCCHGSLVELFVRDDCVHMTSYQRSADVLLGVPHNWIQYWALLLYFAHHAHYQVGTLMWMFGDLHLYKEESHLDTATKIFECFPIQHDSPKLKYEYSGSQVLGTPEFKASDFSMEGIIPDPVVTLRPKLLA